jgi:hypothetical protein
MSVTAFADELEQQKPEPELLRDDQKLKWRPWLERRQQPHEASGRPSNGRTVFGYDNLEVLDANGERSHVVQRINEDEVTIIRRMLICVQRPPD